MCGICGIIGREARDEETKGMLAAIAHRGPDAEGTFKTDRVFLGHRRLAILDLSTAGNQPMHYDQYCIVFNGEIYNYIELRDELLNLGHTFITCTDTEVILHAYAEWGESCVQRLRGMWAFCIYQKNTGEVLLCRDRFGIKPLYYTWQNGVLCFASEIPSLFVAGVKQEPNIDRVVAYLMVDIADGGDTTFFKDINQLAGGSMLILKNNHISIESWYDLNTNMIVSGKDYEKEFFTTIKQHLRSDVKIGSCLSGGLDSSTLVAAVQQELDSQCAGAITAVTAKSEDSSNDETKYAKMVVDRWKLDWEIAYPKYDDFVSYHHEMIKSQAEPVGSPSVFMQYCVMRKAKMVGAKVMLDGQGGDETLLGYERYYISYLLLLIKKIRFIEFIKSYMSISENSKLSLRMLLQYFIYFSSWDIRRWHMNRRMRNLRKDLRDKFSKQYKKLLSMDDDLKNIQIKEIMGGQLSALLRYEDRNSMHFSIESRVPFIDHVLLEKAVNLSINEKIYGGWTKYILRKISEKILSPMVAWRKNKFGFEAPEKIWLEKYIDAMQLVVDESHIIQNIFLDIPKLKEYSLRERWRIYNLAIWEKQYLR